MTTDKNRIFHKKQQSISGISSIGIAILLILVLVNFFSQIFPFKNMGVSYFFPVVAGPVGIIFGSISYFKFHDKISILGIVLNSILTVFPLGFWVIATFIWGP